MGGHRQRVEDTMMMQSAGHGYSASDDAVIWRQCAVIV